MKSENFKNLIRRIIVEETSGADNKSLQTSAVGAISPKRVPEMNANGVDDSKKSKTFANNPNSRDIKNKESLLADMIKVVGAVDESISVVWDDHDDLMISGRDLKFIRISPRWEDYYVIEMMTRNEDRIWATGLDWEQTKDFVKLNLKELNKQPTAVDKAYDKTYRNREDQTEKPPKELSQKDKPKTRPLTTEPPSETKNKEKDYTEPQVKKDDDLPNKPMKEVGTDQKKQIDHKVQDPVKLRRKKPDTKLVIKQT